MELRLLPIITFFSLVLVLVSHAAASPEDYWKKVLPNTPMPGAVTDFLQPAAEWTEDKSTSVGVGKGGVNVDTGGDRANGKGTDVNFGHGSVGVHTSKPNKGGGTNVNVGHGNVGVHTSSKPNKGGADVNVGRKGGVGVKAGKAGKGAQVGVGKGGVSVHAGPKKKPVVVGVKPGKNPFNYNYAATETQLHDDPNVALFFREEDLKPGKSMNLHFMRTTNEGSTFISRKEAESIPFSTQEMPEILARYDIKPESEEARVMKQTVKDCEDKGIEGEDKYCATSLEGMVDYTVSKLGNHVKAGSTEVVTTGIGSEAQKYTMKRVRKNNKDDHAVVCHKQNYAYAVFYCHETKNTASYEVEMVGEEDGKKVNAEAVCHKDTSKWNPKHLAFQVLKVEPGTVPVCHFLPQDHVVWVPHY